MANSGFLSLIHNAALLLSMALLLDIMITKRPQADKQAWQILLGVVIGGLGILLMMTPWVMTPGIIFDTRTILMGISGLFFGGIPTLIAMFITALYRYWLAGKAVWMGISTIVTSGLIGIVWRYKMNKPLEDLTAWELMKFGLLVHIVMVLCAFVMPLQTALSVVAEIALPVILIYPAATMLLGLLLINRLRRERTAEENKQNVNRLKRIVALLQQPVTDTQGFLRAALENAIQLTESTSGYLFTYSEADQCFQLQNILLTFNEPAQVSSYPERMQLESSGVLGEAIRQKRAIVLNDCTHLKQDLPETHHPIHKFLSVPVFYQEKIVAVVGVANKTADYDEQDILQINLLMESVWNLWENQRAKEALQASEARYAAIVNNLPFGLVHILDNQMRYVYIAGEELADLGWTNESIAGKTIFQVFGAEKGAQLAAIYQRAFQGEAVRFEMDFQGRYFISQAAPLQNSQGLSSEIIVLSLNIHDRILAEQELKKAQEKLQQMFLESEQARRALLNVLEDQKEAEEKLKLLNLELEKRIRERTEQLEFANKELEAFAYSVSHDLRAPLRALDGFSDALLSDYAEKFDEKGRHYLKRIREGAARMGQLIDDLLNLSRISRRELRISPVNLSELAKQILLDLKEQWNHPNLIWDVEPGIMVKADPNLIKIALENLLANAIKFSSTRNPALIQVGVSEENGQKVYFVRDNGIGFDMAYADKLFKPFQRLHSDSEIPGTGIGLVTVQRIITRHGGRIWANAQVNQGAAFFFTLGEQ